ncbi:hypothetical protein ACROYT_G022221 [Oculina patagonica]
MLNEVHEFKLIGYPFAKNISSNDAVLSRKMAGSVLHRLYRDGWKLLISSDLTRTMDLTTWIFKKMPVSVFSSQPFMVVGLSSTDTLMVLNAPADLHHTFKDVIDKTWPRGIQRWSYENSVLLIKLKGTPWHPDDDETVHSRQLLQTLVNDLQARQWSLYGNSNLESGTNTLFFEHNPNIALGQPSPPHFTISLNKHDTLRLISTPESLISAVRDVIQTSWRRGIQQESRYFESWEFKLRGNPWWASGEEAVDSRYLILKLIESMQAYGWSVIASIDSSRKLSDKSALLFRQSQPRQSPVFCMSLNETDKLRLINAPEDVTKICQDVIQAQYLLGIQRVQRYGNSLEFKLLGNPWGDDHDGLHGRSLICHLFLALANHHWRPVISADVSAKYVPEEYYPVDVDSIFFTFDPAAVQPSAPPPRQVPYYQPYSQPFAPPPSYGFLQDSAPPPYEPPAYGAFST